MSELYFSRKYCYKLSSIDILLKSIDHINYVKIEDSSNTTGRGAIALEEIIFYSEEDAKSLQDYIRYTISISYYWDTIDKNPSDLFRRENKIYYVKLLRRAHTGSGEIRGISAQLKT